MKHIFVHIGKTAGTSFRVFLQTNVPKAYFGYGKLWYLTDARDTNKFLESEPNGMAVLEQFDLFSEHFCYGLHRYLKTKDYQYIAMLREPVSRTVSAYRYGIDRGWMTEDKKILEWFNEEEHKDQKHYQLNHVSGVPADEPYEVKLQVGLKNLKDEKFLFGLTNKYDEFIDICCSINKWNPQYSTTNVTKAKANVSDEEEGELKELLKEEIRFYNEAVEIYNDKYKSLIK